MSGQDAQIIFFGDQTVDTLQNIKILANQARTSPIIARFLRECADVVQVNLSELDTKEKQPYLRFESILELAEIFAEQNTPFEAVSTILFFIAQFGDLLLYVCKESLSHYQESLRLLMPNIAVQKMTHHSSKPVVTRRRIA